MSGKLSLFLLVVLAGVITAHGLKFPSFLKSSSTPENEDEDVFLSAEEDFQPEPEEPEDTTEIAPPEEKKRRCTISGTTASCCAHPGRKLKINIPVCLNLSVNVSSLSIVGSLSASNKVLYSKDIASARSVCVPLPPPAILFRGCFNLYHIDIDKNSKSLEVCPEVTINNVVGVKFDCIKYSGGRLSITTSQDKGESSALLSINVNKGKPGLSIKRPSLSDLTSLVGK